jgi:hypothetical protein
VAKNFDTAMNALGTAAAVSSFLNLGKKSTFDNKVGQFYANLNKYSIAKTNRFEVRFGMPPMLRGYVASTDAQLLTLRCESAIAPGVTINTSDVQRYGYGLAEKVPTGASYGGFSCSFIGDSQGLIYKLFYRWMTGIVKFDEKPNASGKMSYNSLEPYTFAYKQDYAADINLLTYSENNDELISYDIFEAFPVSLGDISYNWGENDNLVRIPVQFAFSHAKVHNLNEKANFAEGSKNSLGLLGSLIKTGTAIQTIAAMRRPQSINDAINVVNNAKVVIGAM